MVTLFTALPVPSSLFQLPPSTSFTTNELSSPIPTVVRSVLPAGLAQPLVTAIAGPVAGGLSIGVAGVSPVVGPLAGRFSAGVGGVSPVGACGVVPGTNCPTPDSTSRPAVH